MVNESENKAVDMTPEEAMQAAVESPEIGAAHFSIRQNGLILVGDCTVPSIYAPNLIAALRERANYLAMALAQGQKGEETNG